MAAEQQQQAQIAQKLNGTEVAPENVTDLINETIDQELISAQTTVAVFENITAITRPPPKTFSNQFHISKIFIFKILKQSIISHD